MAVTVSEYEQVFIQELRDMPKLAKGAIEKKVVDTSRDTDRGRIKNED